MGKDSYKKEIATWGNLKAIFNQKIEINDKDDKDTKKRKEQLRDTIVLLDVQPLY